MNLMCACGSDSFKAPKVTLVLRGLPCEITEDGPQYDKDEAEQADGWDYNQESRVICSACGKEYDIAQDSQANICLQPAIGHRRQAKPDGLAGQVAEPATPYTVLPLLAAMTSS